MRQQGRIFLRQLFMLLSLDKANHHFIRINTGAKADIMWWHVFLQDWNGSSVFPPPTTSVEVISDASGSFGCGAFVNNLGWFQLQWPASRRPVNVAAKELVPVVIATAVWGHCWTGKGDCFRCDNMAAVSVLNTRTLHNQLLMHLLRCLSFFAAYFRFDIKAPHIPGVLNTAADAIISHYFSLSSHRPKESPCLANTGRATSDALPGLGLTSLDPHVEELFEQGIASAVRSA